MTSRLKIALKYSVLLTFSIFLLASCSRKKDNFVSRSWHSVGTEYNILYNGNLALEQGKTNLNVDKVNLVLRMFGHELAPVSIKELSE